MKEVNGTQIQQEIQSECAQLIQKRDIRPRLDLVYVGNDSTIEMFMRLKKEFGEEIGAHVVMHTFQKDTKLRTIAKTMTTLAHSEEVDGIVVQLPVPDQLDGRRLLNMIPQKKDVDLLSADARNAFESGHSPILPPVVGAIDAIFQRYAVTLDEKSVRVLGNGRLVGGPTATWLQHQGVTPRIIEKDDDLSSLENADIIIAGAGDPHIIKPNDVKEGAILIDAGTSQTDGGTAGDIDPACKEKASLFSPVPGGIGPITVAKVFENLLSLHASA